MFRSHSPYSPFFTSGLLSEPIPESMEMIAPQDQSAVYFDIVFNDDDHYRSFLSLDLAETQSMRSASLKRKASSKYMARSSAKIRSEITPIFEVPSLTSLPLSPLKETPSGVLPKAPGGQKRPLLAVPPRLPSLPPLPSIDLDLPASPKFKTFLTKKGNASSGNFPSNPPARAPSVASSRTRVRNRAAALAHLEGRRSKALPGPIPSRQIPKNFMIMSDDEDEEGGEEEEDIFTPFDRECGDDWLFEPEDAVLPLSPTPKAHSSSSRRSHSNPLREELSPKRKASQRRGKNGPNKNEWFAPKSFIDLYNDNDDNSELVSSNWNWRSFIEVASLS